MKSKMNILELLKNENVEWKKLGDIGKFYGGITGKTKQDFNDGNVKFITYKNIYLNPATDLNVEDKVKIKPEENQRKLMYGDILFTGSSETPDECGISSVITTKLTEDIYLNSFCFFLRLNDSDLLLPDFSKHLFRSETLRIKIGETASGVTRFNVSKDLMKKIEIPIPSIETQKKIVETLDKFTEYVTELQAELQAELQYRTLQYSYYRDKLLSEEYLDRKQLLSSTSNKIVWKSIKEICTFRRGQSITFKDVVEGNVPVISGGQKPAYYHNVSNRVGKTIAIAGSGVNAGYVSYWEIPVFLNDAFSIEPFSDIDTKYLYYFLQSQQNKIYSFKKGSGVPHVYGEDIGTLKIVIPPLAIQQKVVNILDKFQDILKDTEGLLPTEIEQRQKQYEYYREKLLTFDTGDKTIFTDRQTDRVFNT